MSDDPALVGEVLDGLLRSLGAPGAAAVRSVFDAWPQIVGTDLATVITPVRVDHSELVVVVADPARASQLRWEEAGILKRCAELAGVEPSRLTVRIDPTYQP